MVNNFYINICIFECILNNVLIMKSLVLGTGSSQRILACLSTLHLFAKIRPQLLVNHALTLQPYLSLKCQVSSKFYSMNKFKVNLEKKYFKVRALVILRSLVP